MPTRNWQLPETIPIWAEIKDAKGVYTAVDSVVMTLVAPDNTTVILDDVTMDATDDVGFYVYYWNPEADSDVGWYKVIVTATDGTGVGAKSSIQTGGFKVEAVFPLEVIP